ncbi:MAG: Omp28-related outer membrane protein, partial [Flavobacteriaceae bacterium]|nr:Omp28-related outer membrane protein [Flavobacteriaceae bacterium]
MKNYLLIPFFALFILVSCSGGESTGSSSNEPVLSSIMISSDLSSIGLGDTVVFSAFTNLGLDVTSESVFSIAGSPISGNTYIFQEQGNFTVKAVYDNITSNSIVINVSVPVTAINLSSNSDTYYLGEEIIFNVVGNNGANLTSQATINVVGDNELEENTYTSSVEGVIGFVASFEDLTSPEYEITVLPAPTKFNQNVMIEDYTGTWCGYCPRISHAIDLVKEQTSEAVVVAIHRGSTDPSNSSYDPYNFSAGVLEDLIGLQGYPTGMLNRTTEWINPEPNNVSQVVNLASGQADVGLALSPTLNGNTMNIDVNVKFGGQFSASNAKLV